MTKEHITNLNDPEGWTRFNKILGDAFYHIPPASYGQYEQTIKDTRTKSFERITVTKTGEKIAKIPKCQQGAKTVQTRPIHQRTKGAQTRNREHRAPESRAKSKEGYKGRRSRI